MDFFGFWTTESKVHAECRFRIARPIWFAWTRSPVGMTFNNRSKMDFCGLWTDGSDDRGDFRVRLARPVWFPSRDDINNPSTIGFVGGFGRPNPRIAATLECGLLPAGSQIDMTSTILPRLDCCGSWTAKSKDPGEFRSRTALPIWFACIRSPIEMT
jgi:hypothetical protein